MARVFKPIVYSVVDVKRSTARHSVENLSNGAIFNGAFESNQAITLVVVLVSTTVCVGYLE